MRNVHYLREVIMFCNKYILCLLSLVNSCYSVENSMHVISDDITINSNQNNEQYNNNNNNIYLSNHYHNLNIKQGTTEVVSEVNIVVGNNNDDTNFELQNYAKLYIPDNAKLKLYKDSKIQVQKDGILVNEGETLLREKATLTSIQIDTSENSSDFIIKKSNRILKHGIDNTNGTITFENGSKITVRY